MELLLNRDKQSGLNTLGTLSVNGIQRWFTLEDVVREIPGVPVAQWKVKGATAIPSGRYRVVKTWSPKYGRMMYLIDSVEGFVGIRFHSGNDKEDTEGCILLGKARRNIDADLDLEIIQSKIAVAEFEATLDAVNDLGEPIFIEVKNSF